MNIQIYRSSISVIVILFVAILVSACSLDENANLNLILASGAQLTPTMHTAFQLTPASVRMGEPVPFEGITKYETEDLDGNSSEQLINQVETPLSQLDEETDDLELFGDGSGSLGSGLIEGSLVNGANDLIVNKVVVITPMPQSPQTAVSTNSAQTSQPLPIGTPSPPSTESNASTVSAETAMATATLAPTPICGGNQLHNVGPAHLVEKIPIDFDEFGIWMRSEDTYGAFLQTSHLSRSGATAAWLCYFFNRPEDETVVFTQIHPISGQPNTVRMWVYGNRSGHFLGVWVLDRDQETWLIPLGPILHDGWEEMEATFFGPNAEPIFYISGPSNHQIDFPISFRAVSLNDSPDESIIYGGIVIDEIDFITK